MEVTLGSWFESDGITQMPIYPGDKIRAIILMKNKEGKGCIYYPNDEWLPFCFPIAGTYEDYGEIGNIKENLNTQIIVNHIQTHGFTKDKNYKLEDLKKANINKIMDLISVGVLSIKDPMLGDCIVSYEYILEDVYQAMINYNTIEVDYNRDSNNNYYYKPIKDIIINQTFNWYEKSLLMSNKNFLFGIFEDGPYIMRSGNYGLEPIKEYLLEAISNNVPIEDGNIRKILNHIIEAALLNFSITSARKIYHPQSGKGSQGRDEDIHKVLSDTIASISKKRHQEDLEDSIDMEEKDENGYFPYMLAHNKEVDDSQK